MSRWLASDVGCFLSTVCTEIVTKRWLGLLNLSYERYLFMPHYRFLGYFDLPFLCCPLFVLVSIFLCLCLHAYSMIATVYVLLTVLCCRSYGCISHSSQLSCLKCACWAPNIKHTDVRDVREHNLGTLCIIWHKNNFVRCEWTIRRVSRGHLGRQLRPLAD